jgi:hypothetical protein
MIQQLLHGVQVPFYPALGGKGGSLSLLAPSPAAFKYAKIIRGMKGPSTDPGYGPWSATNRGIRIESLPIIEDFRALQLLTSEGFKLRTDWKPAVALIYCYRSPSVLATASDFLPGQYALALYKDGDIYYRFGKPESLILIDSDFKENVRENCIIRLQVGLARGWNEERPDLTQSLWIIRETPKERHGFNISGIYVQDLENPENCIVFHLECFNYGGGTTVPNAILFWNDTTKQSFIVVVGTEQDLPWLDILTNPTTRDLRTIVNSYRSLNGPRRRITYLDYNTTSLHDGKEVSVSIVRGVKDDKRVFFLDISIHETRSDAEEITYALSLSTIKQWKEGSLS